MSRFVTAELKSQLPSNNLAPIESNSTLLLRWDMLAKPDRYYSDCFDTVLLAVRTLMKGPGSRKPCARPTSTPRSRGATPVRYAGRLLRKFTTSGLEVTGVSSIPTNGSPFTGWMAWACTKQNTHQAG